MKINGPGSWSTLWGTLPLIREKPKLLYQIQQLCSSKMLQLHGLNAHPRAKVKSNVFRSCGKNRDCLNFYFIWRYTKLSYTRLFKTTYVMRDLSNGNQLPHYQAKNDKVKSLQSSASSNSPELLVGIEMSLKKYHHLPVIPTTGENRTADAHLVELGTRSIIYSKCHSDVRCLVWINKALACYFSSLKPWLLNCSIKDAVG